MYTISERVTSDKNPSTFYDKLGDEVKNDIRVACPGIVQSFDPIEQTVTVQPAIRERIKDQYGNFSYVNLPLIVDVPILFPRAGNFILTMPPQQGDEVLVIFGDMCEDAWWSNGGVQNPIEQRRHDLSDAFALFGVWSQPRRIANFNTSGACLQTLDGSTSIVVTEGTITLTAATVNVEGTLNNNGVNLTDHYHLAPAGGGDTGGPL
jgi:hypothetical protein